MNIPAGRSSYPLPLLPFSKKKIIEKARETSKKPLLTRESLKAIWREVVGPITTLHVLNNNLWLYPKKASIQHLKEDPLADALEEVPLSYAYVPALEKFPRPLSPFPKSLHENTLGCFELDPS
ncbi:MAG: hypothetical protein FJZ63_06260 [Chlamydiae bacterium]|nr:hypothetical protein [Chlamydiota bacterium]